MDDHHIATTTRALGRTPPSAVETRWEEDNDANPSQTREESTHRRHLDRRLQARKLDNRRLISDGDALVWLMKNNYVEDVFNAHDDEITWHENHCTSMYGPFDGLDRNDDMDPICPAGRWGHQNMFPDNKCHLGDLYCVECPAGYYSAENELRGERWNVCTLCEMGKYQPETGQPACLQCPGDSTTSTRGLSSCDITPSPTKLPTGSPSVSPTTSSPTTSPSTSPSKPTSAPTATWDICFGEGRSVSGAWVAGETCARFADGIHCDN